MKAQEAHDGVVQAKPRILVVDDNADAANSISRLLRLLGNDVRVCHDGPAAIQLVEAFEPAVILLDLGMPGMDGLETAQRIRKLHPGSEPAFIAITGWGNDRDRQLTSGAGFIAHLIKPVNVEELERALAKTLR